MSDEQMAHIERMLVRRYWLFWAGIVSIMICAIAIYGNAQAIIGLSNRITEQDARSAKNTAMVESAIAQQIIFQTTIAQIMDKMSKDNPKVRVPRVPVRPPNPYPPPAPSPAVGEYNSPTDADLTRKTSNPTPLPTQTPQKSKPTRKHRPKSTPTPKPWFRLFKATR